MNTLKETSATDLPRTRLERRALPLPGLDQLWILLALALIVLQWASPKPVLPRMVLLGLALPTAAGVLLSLSRASWLGLTVGLVLIGALRYRRIHQLVHRAHRRYRHLRIHLVNRLPQKLAASVRSVTLVAPSDSATFEIHISNWLPGVTTQGLPTRPELSRLPVPPLCLYGAGDNDTPCTTLPASQSVQIGSGHHLGGDAEGIVDRVLQRRGAAGCAGKEPCV